jgi:hypothetical protein
MKNTIIATFLAVSGFALASVSPVNAQTAIVAALYPSSNSLPAEVQSENINNNQIILAISTTPEGLAIADSLVNGISYDRIVTINRNESLACMVNGNGSDNGAVMCGFIDYE